MVTLYCPHPYVGQSFVGEKIVTVPKQSLTLREILKRFTRGESLPVQKEGYYDTRFGDLEKLLWLDIYDKFVRVEQLKKFVSDGEAYLKRKQKEEKEKE